MGRRGNLSKRVAKGSADDENMIGFVGYEANLPGLCLPVFKAHCIRLTAVHLSRKDHW